MKTRKIIFCSNNAILFLFVYTCMNYTTILLYKTIFKHYKLGMARRPM